MTPAPAGRAPVRTRRRMLAGIASLAAAVLPARAAAGAPAWQPRAPQVPDVALLDHRGQRVPLRPLLAQDTVALNFIYTGCASFCPPQTAVFRQLQELLRAEAGAPVLLVSLSIDPLGDPPPALARYAQRFEAALGRRDGWLMLTGTPERAGDVAAVQAAFGAHAASLQEHPAQTWVGCAAKSRWKRTLGLAGAPELLRWLRQAAA